MIADRLRDARKQAAMTQEEVAERVGVHPLTISHFETGRVSPKLETLVRLAAALGTTVGALLGETEPPALPATGTES